VPRVRSLTIAMVLTGALALAACGGGGSDKPSQTPRLSAAAYRAQLTQLCSASEQDAAKIGGVQGANASALADYFDKLAALETKRRLQFARLRPPAELQDPHSRIVPLLAQEIDALKQTAAGFRSGSDPVAVFKAFKTTENRVLRQQAKLLDKLKVAGCRSAPSTAQGAS